MSDVYYYVAFGLRIISDIFMPELLIYEKEDSKLANMQDVIIKKEQISSKNFDKKDYVITGEYKKIFFELNNIARFTINNGNCIYYCCEPQIREETLRLFILGSCMGVILQQLGYIVLHGNAVSFDGKQCGLVIGHSGSGKSTFAAKCLQQGAYILADDVCAVRITKDNIPEIIPSFPQIKIWQDSADILGIDTKNLQRIRLEENKFSLKIKNKFIRHSLSVGGIFELTNTPILTNELNGVDKLKCLIVHSYRERFLHVMNIFDDYIKKLLKLVGTVQVKQIRRNFDLINYINKDEINIV